MKKKAQSLIAVALAVSISLGATPARADLWGADVGVLNTLLTQQIAAQVQNGSQFAEEMAKMVLLVEETQKYVALAQDAVQGFKDFGEFADSVFQHPESMLQQVMPEADYLKTQLASPQSWGRGTGELQRMIQVCFQSAASGGGASGCAEFKQAVTAQQVRDSISQTFGTAPPNRDDIASVDVEASRAISGSMSMAGKASVASQQAEKLMEKCRTGTGQDAVQACQAAANMGTLLQVQQTAELNEQVAEANRLQALELAKQNADDKRRALEVQGRKKMLKAGAQQMAPPSMKFEGSEGMLK